MKSPPFPLLPEAVLQSPINSVSPKSGRERERREGYLFLGELFGANGHGDGEDRRETHGDRSNGKHEYVIDGFQHIHLFDGEQDDEENRHQRKGYPD